MIVDDKGYGSNKCGLRKEAQHQRNPDQHFSRRYHSRPRFNSGICDMF